MIHATNMKHRLASDHIHKIGSFHWRTLAAHAKCNVSGKCSRTKRLYNCVAAPHDVIDICQG